MIPQEVADILDALVAAFDKGYKRPNLTTGEDGPHDLLMRDAWALYEKLTTQAVIDAG